MRKNMHEQTLIFTASKFFVDNSVILTISEYIMNIYRLFKPQIMRHNHQKKPSKLLLS